MKFTIKNYLNAHTDLINKINLDNLDNIINLIEKKYLDGATIYTCGNGGSATTASHFITDWVKMVNLATGKKINGFSLCDNVGLITAYANDTNFDNIYAGQLRANLQQRDLLIVVSGSGNSKNIINALIYANEVGADTLAVVGYDGGVAMKLAKYTFLVPSFDMQLCEDFHLMFGHLVMKKLCRYNINHE